MKILPILVGLVFSRRLEDSENLPRLLGEKLIQSMSSEELLSEAREAQTTVSNEVFMSYFNSLDGNNDSFVDLDEIFTVREASAREWPTEELIAAELEHLSTVKAGHEKTIWGEPMDFETYKMYCSLYYIAELKVFYGELGDKNGSVDNEWFTHSMSMISEISKNE